MAAMENFVNVAVGVIVLPVLGVVVILVVVFLLLLLGGFFLAVTL